MPMLSNPRKESRGMLLALLGVIMFAGTAPATKVALTSLSPLFIASGRAVVSGVIACAILIIARARLPQPKQFLILFFAGIMIVIAYPVLLTIALETVPASHSGVILGILPLTSAAAARVLLKERPSPRFWLFAIAGSSVVISYSSSDTQLGVGIGDIYILAAAAFTSIGYAYSGLLVRSFSGWEVICWMLVLALPISLPLAMLHPPTDAMLVNHEAWFAFAYVSLFSMLIGFFAWNAGIALAGVSLAGQMQLFLPFITIALAATINGDTIDLKTIITAIVIVVIVALSPKTLTTPATTPIVKT